MRDVIALLVLCSALGERSVVLKRRSVPRKHRMRATAAAFDWGRVNGGEQAATKRIARPSFGWAVLHNWLYFLSLGLCIPVLPRVIATAVNPDGSSTVTAKSSAIGGDVEGVDKLLTFLTVGALGALSDHVGRRPLIALSAMGYALTVATQALSSSIWQFYVADMIDGLTSCMNAVCSAYVIDATTSANDRAIAVGAFQGVSVAGAFIVGFPVSGLLGRNDPKKPMWLAVGLQFLNCLLALFVTPESLSDHKKALADFDLTQANPFAALRRLFGFAHFRLVALAFAFAWTANLALNTTFVNYVNKVFGWGPKQAGPLLVAVGAVLAIFPRAVVPILGTANSVKLGSLLYAAAFASIGLATTPSAFFLSVLVCGLGSVAIPALVATIASRAKDTDRGATLGALQTLQELCAAAAYPLYGRAFGLAITKAAASSRPNIVLATPFYLAATLCLAAFAVFSLGTRGPASSSLLP